MKCHLNENLTILFFIFPFILLGQKPFYIEGYVSDYLGSPLDFVSVYATVKEAVVSFSTTNEQGFYSLSVPSDSSLVSVTASMLGFKKESFQVDIQQENQNKKKLDFTLLPNPFSIEEVVVRDKLPPMLAKSDTTEYHVAAFSDSTEYSVEDILKKLPGVHVSEQGAISVNGKPIDKVLVEGDDVFGANYTIVTRNVRANMIDKVQVIDHYRDNPVLKDVVASESMVLNLSIDEDKKRIISGTLTAGAGRGDEWKGYAHTNLFSFTKKSKTIFLGNSNNTGFNALGELDAMSGSLFAGENSLKRGMLQNNSQLALPVLQEVGLPSYFTNRTRSGMAALNQNYKFSDQFKVKASGTVLVDRRQQNYINQTDFFLEDEVLSILEATDYSREGRMLELEVETNYFSPNQTKSFRTTSSIQTANNHIGLSLLRTALNQDKTIPIRISDTPQNYYSAAEFTTKTGKNTVLQFVVNYSNTNRFQQLNSTSPNYPVFFQVDSILNNLKQDLDFIQKSFNPFIRHIFNKKNLELSIEGGGRFYKNKLNSEISLQDSDDHEELGIGEPYYNNQTINNRTGYLRSYAKKTWGKVDVSVGLNVQHLSLIISDNNTSNQKKKKLWIVVPAFKFQYAPNNDIRLNLFYKYNTELPNEERLYGSWYVSDYQTINRGLSSLSTINKHQVSASYRYRALEKTFFFNTSFSAFLSNNQWGTSYVFSPLLFSQEFFIPAKEKIYLYQFWTEKYISKLESRISFQFNFSNFNNEGKVNNSRRSILNNYYKFNLDYGSAFDGRFNIFITNEFAASKASVNQNNQTDFYNSSIWKSKIKGILRLSKKAHIDASLYRVQNYFEGLNIGSFYSMDMNGIFRIGNKKWQGEINLSVVNLLGNRTFQKTAVSDYYQNQFQLRTIPRFFIFKWDTSF